MQRTILLWVACLALLSGCAKPQIGGSEHQADPHSFARPGEAAVEHMDLDLIVDFEESRIRGRVSLLVRHDEATELWLDTRDLEIEAIYLDDDATPIEWSLGEKTLEVMGRSLRIPLERETKTVHIDYASDPGAAALQWLEPSQTAGGRYPLLLSQSQSILARTWIPCQDTPMVRTTYNATIRVPRGLLALMSAENPTEKSADGVYTFRMDQAIPAYLLALAVGDFEFRKLGPRSGVYAEGEVVDQAAWEFAATDHMMLAAEKLYGPYRWDRFDILVLPPSFPFGGMENPRLTFVTPTLLAGDRSLVSTIAHELAHSWSGNLVTNATWNDFWLNEGFTTYFEWRVMEVLYGRDYAEMLASLGQQGLLDEMKDLDPRDTHLLVDLEGRNPDEGLTGVAYEKGYQFLRLLEEQVGREKFDNFLRGYFDAHAFQSMTTAGFVSYLESNLLTDESTSEKVRLRDWIYGPGLPDNAPVIHSEAFVVAEGELARWLDGAPANSLAVDKWTTHQRQRFLQLIPDTVTLDQLAELDQALGLTESTNAEVLFTWLMRSVQHGYSPADDALHRFLTGVGRNKFIVPLYKRLAETPEGRVRAQAIFAEARPGYHPLSVSAIEKALAP